MNSKERVMAALEHREPDKVPIDFGGHRSSGINAMAYARLKKALGITSGNVYVYDMVQQLAIVEPPVLDALQVDVVEMGRGFMNDDSEWKEWVLPDNTPCLIPAFVNVEKRGGDWFIVSRDGIDFAVQKEGSVFFEQVYWPLQDSGFENEDFSRVVEALAENMWGGVPAPGAHLPLDNDGLEKTADGAKALRESTDRAVIGLFGGNLFEVPQFLFRMDNYLTYMAMYPDACIRLSEALCDMYLQHLERWLSAVGPCIDLVLFGDDLGGQNGPLMSTAMYRRYFKPYHRKMWRRAKEIAPVKVMLHCCGGIEPLLEDLIEAGLDTINPVQISCKGMEPKALKQNYGDRICFWGGGCDTHKVLPGGSPHEVAEHVRRQVEIMAPGGGFVFQQVHNVMSEVPPENVIAMFEAANEYRYGGRP